MVVTADGLVAHRGRFTLDAGSFAADESGTAVLGPNGAGKTTLLLALQGLIPAAGRIGRPARCAAVFARPAVLRGTALWNVSAIVRDVLRAGAADAVARAHAVLDDVGLGAAAAVDARTLSTGQRQRLALARALACEPQALFLDEPFANVDADARPLLRGAVASYAKRTGCAVVLVTSSFADAAALCGAAVVLRAGRFVHAGQLDQLRHSADPYATALLAEAGRAAE
jgi:ABC-type multidrug transport system ATPase subunit